MAIDELDVFGAETEVGAVPGEFSWDLLEVGRWKEKEEERKEEREAIPSSLPRTVLSSMAAGIQLPSIFWESAERRNLSFTVVYREVQWKLYDMSIKKGLRDGVRSKGI